MDKSWMNLSRVDLRYFNGIENFIKVARQNSNEATYPCPCCRCKLGRWVGLDKMRTHLIDKGFMVGYTTWTMHGEVELGDDQLEDNFGQVSGEPNELYNIPMVEFLNDTLPLRDYQDPMMVDETFDEADYEVNRLANEKYHKLLVEDQTPIYPGSKETVLECILYEMQLKVEGRWSNKSFDRHLERCKRLIRGENKYPGSYREIKHVLSNLGLNYEVIHACEHGCVLYYKELSDLDNCPVCGEARYDYVDGNRKAAKKFVRYFADNWASTKKYVKNTRYPEGCIAEQYIAQECVTFVKLYLEGNTFVKFVTWERDQNRKTQNSGVMVESDDEVYYGVLEDVSELMYPQGVTVIVFKCRWFNENRGDIKRDHGI
ncbi:unnamed protein product [Rhodiola kirilowii]